MSAVVETQAFIKSERAAAVVDAARLAPDAAAFDSLRSSLQAIARDPMAYAVVIESADVAPVGAAAAPCIAAAANLAWQLECFPKPAVALIDGAVSGFAGDLALLGTHRVAGPGFLWRPQLSAGDAGIPDAGVAFHLARLPNGVGRFLALTGRALGRADAFRLGLVTHCVDATEFPSIRAALADADPVDPILDERHQSPGAGELERNEALIARVFSSGSLTAILNALDNAASGDQAFALAVRAEITRVESGLLVRRLGQIERAGVRDLRATLIDAVTAAGDVEFTLPIRAEMQSLRAGA
jgi:enoyl-CoA hydratase